ncbi:MAG: RNA polymerase sigma factor [Acidobacteriota bacterium]|nr:RNA polymerase sigma factor [Acidobacteriota bacterium]
MLKSLRRKEREATFKAEALAHLDRLYRIAMWLERDQERAENLVRETLTRGLRSFDKFDAETSLCTWLCRIMYKVVDDAQLAGTRAHRSDTEETFDGTIQFETHTPPNLSETEILLALRSLTPNHQEMLLLSDAEDMTYKEIAGALNITTGVVMARLSRARKMLRTELVRIVNKSESENATGGAQILLPSGA